jgi:site-specific recombinase XerD
MRSPVTFYQDGGKNHVYLTAYGDWLKTQKMSANTVRVYHSRIKQFLLFVEYTHLNDLALDDQNGISEAMSLYVEFLRQSRKGSVTINANVDAMNNFCHFLGMEVALKRQRCYNRPARVLTMAEQERFLHCAERQELLRDRALALVLFYTGLRISDCAGLNVEQVGVGASSIGIAEGVRLNLNESTTLALVQWLEQRKQLCVAGAAGSALWLTNQGQRLSVPGIAFVVKRIGWQAKLTVSVEMLRRTSLAKSAGALDSGERAARFGGYISQATVGRYGGPGGALGSAEIHPVL